VRASRASSTSAASAASDSRLETATERAPRIGEAVSSRFGWPRAWGTELIRLAQVPYWSVGGSTMALLHHAVSAASVESGLPALPDECGR
jgi:hypothetical protein